MIFRTSFPYVTFIAHAKNSYGKKLYAKCAKNSKSYKIWKKKKKVAIKVIAIKA